MERKDRCEDGIDRVKVKWERAPWKKEDILEHRKRNNHKKYIGNSGVEDKEGWGKPICFHQWAPYIHTYIYLVLIYKSGRENIHGTQVSIFNPKKGASFQACVWIRDVYINKYPYIAVSQSNLNWTGSYTKVCVFLRLSDNYMHLY